MAAEVIEIDGSMGEGGGQVLRSALSLSLLTGRPFRIVRIRANRPEPGLKPQHLQSVRAAAAVSRAKVQGDRVGSPELAFEPGTVKAGEYSFDIGTAGSVSLVLQTIFVPLATAGGPSRLTIAGGTHVPWSPPFPFLERAWLPWMRRIGFDADLDLERAGFYPRGGGSIRALIRPGGKPAGVRAVERGRLIRVRGVSYVARLDDAVAERQRGAAEKRLRRGCRDVEIAIGRLDSIQPGTCMFLQAELEHATLFASALGARGKPAERVGEEVAMELEEHLASEGAVDPHLADQLVLPLALAEGGSELRPCRVTPHLETNIEVVRAFLPREIAIREGRVRIDG